MDQFKWEFHPGTYNFHQNSVTKVHNVHRESPHRPNFKWLVIPVVIVLVLLLAACVAIRWCSSSRNQRRRGRRPQLNGASPPAYAPTPVQGTPAPTTPVQYMVMAHPMQMQCANPAYQTQALSHQGPIPQGAYPVQAMYPTQPSHQLTPPPSYMAVQMQDAQAASRDVNETTVNK